MSVITNNHYYSQQLSERTVIICKYQQFFEPTVHILKIGQIQCVFN